MGYVFACSTNPTTTYDIYPLAIKNYDNILPTNRIDTIHTGTGSIATGHNSTKLKPQKQSVAPTPTKPTQPTKNDRTQTKQAKKPTSQRPKPRVPTKKPPTKPTPRATVDLDKLAYAIAMSETNDCRK